MDPLTSGLVFFSTPLTRSMSSLTPCSPLTLWILFSRLPSALSSSGKTSFEKSNEGKSEGDRASSTAELNLAGWAVDNVMNVVPGDLKGSSVEL